MATAGPSFPGTGADDATVGTVAWTNPGNITAAGNVYATATTTTATTHYLKATGFGFAIPAGATINGIQLDINRKESAGSNKDATVSLLKAGVLTGSNKADTVTSWPVTQGTKTYGNSSDLWGATWTDTDINSSTFGAVLNATNTGKSHTLSVDYFQITVTYTASGGTTAYQLSMVGVGA